MFSIVTDIITFKKLNIPTCNSGTFHKMRLINWLIHSWNTQNDKPASVKSFLLFAAPLCILLNMFEGNNPLWLIMTQTISMSLITIPLFHVRDKLLLMRDNQVPLRLRLRLFLVYVALSIAFVMALSFGSDYMRGNVVLFIIFVFNVLY